MSLSYNTTFRLNFASSIQYLLLSFSFDLCYDEVKHQQRAEHIPFASKSSYTLTLMNNLRTILSQARTADFYRRDMRLRFLFFPVTVHSRLLSLLGTISEALLRETFLWGCVGVI